MVTYPTHICTDPDPYIYLPKCKHVPIHVHIYTDRHAGNMYVSQTHVLSEIFNGETVEMLVEIILMK